MPQTLLDTIRAQIRDRARALEPAVHESGRLGAALAALDGLGGDGAVGHARGGDVASAALPPRQRASAKRGAPKRARRGANRAAVLRVVSERPGVGASELSSAAGVAKPVLYALLRTLEERGEVAKERLPGGTTGYRLADSKPPTPAGAPTASTRDS